MAATVRADYYGASASEPAGVTAESGIKFNREDTQVGTSPVPIPTNPPTPSATNYSWIKQLALNVTASSATTINNRRVYLSGAPATGLYPFFKGAATYVQAASGNKPTDDATTNGAVPSGYTALTATTLGTAHVWAATGVSAGSTGRNGDFLVLLLGVGVNFTGGAGASTSVPTFSLAYDEA